MAIKSNNPMLFCVVYHGQQANSRSGAQTLICHGCSYLPFDVILLPPAEDMIDDIREEPDDDAETGYPNSKIFLTTKTGFQKFERQLQRRIIRQQ